MQTALYYVIGLGTFALVAGGVIAFFAIRNAPEGFEGDEGFVGVTKGDEVLLKEFANGHRYSAVHGSMDLMA